MKEMVVLEETTRSQYIPWLEEDRDTPLEEINYDLTARIMRALAHPARIELVCLLSVGPCVAGDLAMELELSQSTLSKHLRVLREAGLITSAICGHKRIYSLVRNDLPVQIAALTRNN